MMEKISPHCENIDNKRDLYCYNYYVYCRLRLVHCIEKNGGDAG